MSPRPRNPRLRSRMPMAKRTERISPAEWREIDERIERAVSARMAELRLLVAGNIARRGGCGS